MPVLSAPKLDETDWEAVRKVLQLLLTYLGKRRPSDLVSVAVDWTVGYRVMRQHQDWYGKALEATCHPISIADAAEADVLASAARAAAFACAVYGAAFREGHLNTIAAFLGGAAAHNAGKWSNADNSAAFVSAAGVALEDLVLSSWSERTFEPAFCVAWAHDQRWLVLSIRGTVDWRALLTDAAAHTAPLCGGSTHEGMLRGAQSVLARTLPLLRSALRERPDYELVCAGHSMGAGAAVLSALLLREGVGLEPDDPPALRRTKAYGIGTPPLLNPELADRTVEYVVSVERGMDFISRLSVFAVDRLLYELTQASMAKMATDWFMNAIGQKDTYQRRFERTFGSDMPVAEILVPPGRILHLDTQSRQQSSTSRTPPNAYWALPTFYQRYMLGLTMLQDHLPREYLTDVSLVAAAASPAPEVLHLEDFIATATGALTTATAAPAVAAQDVAAVAAELLPGQVDASPKSELLLEGPVAELATAKSA